MAIHRSIDADGCTVTFVLTTEDHVAPVSVVGSFNDWTPGAHPFEPDQDGSRSVTIVVPEGTDIFFRYLGPDGYWFDDPDADEITAEGSVLRAPATAVATESASRTVDDPTEPSSVSAPEADIDSQSTPDESQPAAADETGERLETVASRINEAKSAAGELVDRDIIGADAMADTVGASSADPLTS